MHKNTPKSQDTITDSPTPCTLLMEQTGLPTIHIALSSPMQSQTLAQAIWLSGTCPPPPLCSGLGRCGACKVRFLTPPPSPLDIENKVLGSEAVAQGWRLACRHTVQQLTLQASTLHIELPTSTTKTQRPHATTTTDTASTHIPVKLAIDVGTTSLCWQAVNADGEIVRQDSLLNPQMGAGADIISRLQFAADTQGKKTLAHLIRTCIRDIITRLSPTYAVEEICLAANTAMTSIFLEKNIESLAHAPYGLPLQGHSWEQIQDLPPLYIPVQLAPFVGGDISAGYAALLARQKKDEDISFPFILADLGTNGEFILALNPEKAFITSVPMGPALEGIGLSHGHMADASPGIVNAVHLGAAGLLPQSIAQDAPRKLCGTGYLSLIHALLKVGVLTPSGLFASPEQKTRSPFFKKIAQHLTVQDGEPLLQLWPSLAASPMGLSALDVEEILKVKAAFSLALSHLLAHAGLAPWGVKHIYLAGAMGAHVHAHDLEGLGFVPQGTGARIVPVGNIALEGAKQLLLQSSLREELAQWSKSITLVKLTEDEHFTEKFMQHMNFSYTG